MFDALTAILAFGKAKIGLFVKKDQQYLTITLSMIGTNYKKWITC